MKILHICLACFYVDNMSYQENMLPKMNHLDGHEVRIITSTYTFSKTGEASQRHSGTYVNENGISVTVLDYANGKFDKSLRRFIGLYDAINSFEPDIIFSHGTQFFDIDELIRYKKENPKVLLYGDQHGDYYNMGLTVGNPVRRLVRRALQTILWGHCARKYAKYAEKIWGVTPARCDFLKTVYLVPENKIGLLVMGGDDSGIRYSDKDKIRSAFRKVGSMPDDAFVICTGGKIDSTKNIHLLMQAVDEMNNDNIYLVVFGEPNEEMKPIFDKYKDNEHICLLGWANQEQINACFLASDLAVFPGTHSVLWEQACACGIPCVFKDWDGMHHVDVGGNCSFLEESSVEEIKEVLTEITENTELYNEMLAVSTDKCIDEFSYSSIARRAIGERK